METDIQATETKFLANLSSLGTPEIIIKKTACITNDGDWSEIERKERMQVIYGSNQTKSWNAYFATRLHLLSPANRLVSYLPEESSDSDFRTSEGPDAAVHRLRVSEDMRPARTQMFRYGESMQTQKRTLLFTVV